MDLYARLNQLSSQMYFEPDSAQDCPTASFRARAADAINIFYAAGANGKRVPLLKTMLTSACERDCYYCPFRAGRDFHRATLKPDEMARVFMTLQRAGLVEGLFLSSGIAGGGRRMQDQIIATAELLRLKYHFTGYLHLKIMPGAEYDQVLRTAQLASRVSINLEAPNPLRLERLAPHKSFFEELMAPLHWVSQIRSNHSAQRAPNSRPPSMTTQFVVGAVGESDLEILQTTNTLNQQAQLNRAYFSAFRPVNGTPLENQPPADPVRQRRLYQASFLLRDYGFGLEDLPFDPSGDLPLKVDPKLAWARQNLSEQPVEINRADRLELLRVPGIGPKGAAAILSARRNGRLTNFAELQRIGLNLQRLQPFITLAGRKPLRQLSFWAGD
ncbi:MAG: helix-hairpin-helix domain-containing protein [Anaerolineales bacterium]|nr:helix-hairpin-helix domain-containing protein [Anaerolineales bacterium]